MVVEKIKNSQTKITFDVTPEEFEKALDKAFEQENAKVTIAGFRAGKAPRSVFEKNYGVEALFAAAIDVILGEKVEEVVKDEKLCENFVGQFQPLLEEKIERNKAFKVSLVIDTYPEVKLPEYKGIEVAKKDLVITDEQVENAVNELARKDATKEVKDGAIAKGDYATFDFVGSVDGVEFPGGKADNYELQIGSGQFIPGFEDQMIGMKSEEVKDLNVTFPESYQEASLAGKAAVFKVTVHEIKVEKFPEFTDEYVKGLKIENVNTLDELKAYKKKELEDARAMAEKDRQTNEVINKLLDACDFEMPQTLIQRRYDDMKAQYVNQAKMYNIPFETFIQIMGATMEQFEDVTNKQAKRQAMFDVVASKIIEVENLVPTKEQIEAKADADAKLYKSTKDEMLKKNSMKYASDLAYEALINVLVSNAKEI